MSSVPAGGADGDDERPLRTILAAASTDGLATVVERFWRERDYGTSRREQGSHLFVVASARDGDDRHLVWVDADAAATPNHVETLVRLAERVGATGATLVSGGTYGPDVYRAVDEHGVECLAEDQLLTFVRRAGLEAFVRERLDRQTGSAATSQAAPRQGDAVADGGAAQTTEVELLPRADHPTTLRAALVVGGGVLTLLSVWGGAAQVTTKLQTCSTGCSLVWLLSFLPLAAMLLGSFAVVVGVFD